MDFFKVDFKDFLKECENYFISFPDLTAVKQLSDAVESQEAKNFTMIMNNIYKMENMTDEDGVVITISTPLGLESRITSNSDGTFNFSMTSAEDRWFRANKTFGDDILGKINFKYNNM